MDICTSAPPEPEQADRNTKSPHKCGLESNLGFNLAVFVELGLLNPVQVEEVGGDDNQGADKAA